VSVRAVGLVEALSGLDPLVVLAFAVVTLLGEPVLLFVAFTLVYWLGPPRPARIGGEEATPSAAVASASPAASTRRTIAVLLALGVAALAATVGLKAAFGLPRPPVSPPAAPGDWPAPALALYRDGVGADGFGFPSGHALGATVVYGGVAALCDVWDRRRRAVAAGVVVALVALSRVVLGVHYLLDVVGGVVAGLAVLWLVLRVASGRPDRAFAVAVALGGAALAATLVTGGAPDATQEAAAALGGGLGGVATWRVLGEPTPRTVPVPVAGVGLVVAGGTFATYAVAPPLPVTVVGDAVAVATILALPALVERARAGRAG
jgi:membrane-associated phospholipid phosphatase